MAGTRSADVRRAALARRQSRGRVRRRRRGISRRRHRPFGCGTGRRGPPHADRRMSISRRIGVTIFALVVGTALAAPALTPHAPQTHFDEYPTAPPMRPRIIHADGSIGRPFVYPLRLVDRLERRYEADRSRPIPIRWFADGYLASIDEASGPWLPLGSDPLGRDVFARLLYGARLSLGLACVASIAALLVGIVVGGPAGLIGGRLDAMLMALADFVLVLPAIYVVLAFRAALPLVLTVPQVFAALTLVLAAAGWPLAAR